MKIIQIPRTLIIISSLFILTGCFTKNVPSEKGGYYHHNLYFGSHFTKNKKIGIRHGCKTATGYYTKSHWLFKNSMDYKNGWFLGRNKCRVFLKIDENGDLVL